MRHLFILGLNAFFVIGGSWGNAAFASLYAFVWLVVPAFIQMKREGKNPLRWKERNLYIEMSRAMIFDEPTRRKVRKIIEHAFANIVPIGKMVEKGDIKEGTPSPLPGDKEEFTVFVKQGFKVVYSVEDQGDEEGRLGLCKHLSISIEDPNALPHPLAVQMAMLEFGFENPLHQNVFWPEQFGEGTQKALNVIEPINGWPEQIKPEILEKSRKVLDSELIASLEKLCEQARKIGENADANMGQQ